MCEGRNVGTAAGINIRETVPGLFAKRLCDQVGKHGVFAAPVEIAAGLFEAGLTQLIAAAAGVDQIAQTADLTDGFAADDNGQGGSSAADHAAAVRMPECAGDYDAPVVLDANHRAAKLLREKRFEVHVDVIGAGDSGVYGADRAGRRSVELSYVS